MKNYCDGGEAILEAFRNLGTDYIMASPGSEWSPVWEALARQKVYEKQGPTYLDLWHEMLAVDMAMGYTQVTGRVQPVLLHAGVGLAQGLLGIYTAQITETPMLVLSGESFTLGEDPHMPIEPQWYGGLSTQGGPHRLAAPVVKWAQQATSGYTLYETVIRAAEMAQRVPKGPVYLSVPLESMLLEWTRPANLRKVAPVSRTQPQASEIEKIATLLIDAKHPVIIAESSGRDPRAFTALSELSEFLGIPVGARSCTFANIPQDHPMNLGSDIGAAMKDADLVFLVRSKAPWYPPGNRPDATVVVINDNPFSATMPYQNIPADHYLEGDVASSLELLLEAVRSGAMVSEKFAERRKHWQAEHDKREKALRKAEADARNKTPIDPVALCGALRETMPSDAAYISETIMHSGLLQSHLAWDQPHSYFGGSGGLGQGLGTALGVKLALPNRPVVALLGDGGFLYNPIVQFFGASKTYDLPILVIIFNNGKYRAMQKGHLHHYPDGVAVESDLWHGVNIDAPEYSQLGRPFGFEGRLVEKPGELKSALQSGLEAVKNGRTSILNIRLSE